jgi:putative Holliday junction resolvase
MGYDFGLRRIGVAVGQDITKTAKPIQTLLAKDGEPEWSQVLKQIKEWSPRALVVGIPYNMDGTEQSITLAARQFALLLHEKTNLVVHEMDERLSTVAAREEVFDAGGSKALRASQVDSVAAKVILEGWLRR